MKRFLLFDSGCSVCNTLAQAIEEEANGWLQAASLHEPSMQHILNRVAPDWSWEPMLLEITTRKTRVFTGLSMRARLVKGLGLKRAYQIAQLVYETNRDNVDQGRRQFLRQSSMSMGGLMLLGMPKLYASPRFQVEIQEWQQYSDEDYKFTLEYPNEWKVDIPIQQPVPLLDEEAITKRIVFSSSYSLVYLDIWHTNNRDFNSWLKWYADTRLVPEMPIEPNALVAGEPALMFLEKGQPDFLVTFFSDGNNVYRLMNHLTSVPESLQAYWHMLNTFSISGRLAVAAKIASDVQQEASRVAERNGILVANCCNYSSSGNPFPCCGDGNCTWWVYRQMGWVPFTGNAKTWWGQVPNYAGWTRNSYPPTNRSSIGWHGRGSYGHVAYIASYSGGSTVNITDMTCNTAWSCVRTTSKSLSYFGGYIYPLWI